MSRALIYPLVTSAIAITLIYRYTMKYMSIRPATIADIPSLHQLAEALHEASIDQDSFKQQVELIINSKDRVILVATNDSDIAMGMLVLNIIYKFPKNECRLDEVVVSPEARGQGFAKALLVAAETWAWEHGASSIELTSRPSREAANTLYQSAGYNLRDTNVYNKKRGA